MSVFVEMRGAEFSSVFKLSSASVVSLVGLIILLVALSENREILKYAACLYAHSDSIIVHLRNSSAPPPHTHTQKALILFQTHSPA